MEAFVLSGSFVKGQSGAVERCPRTRKARAGVVTMVDTSTEKGRKINGKPTPLRNYIFAKRAKPVGMTEGGLVLSDTAKEKPNFGKVVAVGEGGFFRLTGIKMPILVSEGDDVVFGKFGGLEVEYDAEKHMFVEQFDLLAKLKDGEYKAENVEPLFDRVFVKITKRPEETASGIAIASTAADSKNMGEVIATGCGRALENGQFEEMPVAPGQNVLWGDYVGTKITFERGTEYVFLRASDIFAAW